MVSYPSSLTTARLLVFTTAGTLEGNFHYPANDRLSDALRAVHDFVLLSDVLVRLSGGTDQEVHAPFALINVATLQAIVPIEEGSPPPGA
jgi:hypothetical protein